jgi:hypothetical protein
MCIAPSTAHDALADGQQCANRRNKIPTAKPVPRFPSVTIITQNVRGYHGLSSYKKDHIANYIEKRPEETIIILTQETWENNDTTTKLNNTLFFSHGDNADNREKGGVGIILSPKAVNAWKRAGQPDPIRPGKIVGNTRIMAMELHFEDNAKQICKIFFITAYLPCSSYLDEEYENSLRHLKEVLRRCPRDAIPIIGCDMNASIGVADPTEDLHNSPIGMHGNTHTNNRGSTMKDFLRQLDLCSVATFFQKRSHDTWIHPNGNGYQLDHILTKRNELRRFTNSDTIAEITSDHLGVTASLRIAAHIPRKKMQQTSNTTREDTQNTPTNKPKPINWEKLRCKHQTEFNQALKSELEARELHNFASWNLEKACPYDELAEAMRVTAEKISPSDGKKKRPPWFELSEKNIMTAIQHRNTATKEYLQNKTCEDKAKLVESRKIVKNTIIDARNKWLEVKIKEYEDIDTDPRSAWKAIKEINAGFSGHHQKATIVKMRKHDGTTAQNEDENAQVFLKHFEKLANRNEESSYDPTAINKIDSIPTNEELDLPPKKKELLIALRKMQYEKSPGKNGIPTEAFKSLQDSNLDLFHKLITAFWHNIDLNPSEWRQIKLSILPKKGDLSNPNQWRGIALGDIASKCVSSIIASRLTKHLATFSIDEQCGSMIKKGCADATFPLKLALQTLREHNQEAYILFVDLVKAYDTVNREMLWIILDRLGVPPQMITVLKKLYTDVTIHMKVGTKTQSFGSTCGVKQGDNLGPILFIYVIQAVSLTLDKKWTFQKPDFRWRPFTANGQPKGSLTNINRRNKGQNFSQWKSYYVDDAAFLLLNREDLINASKLIVSHFRRFGLTVHTGVKSSKESSKTEAMHFPAPKQEQTANDTEDIDIDGDRYFSFCDKFKYLGSIFKPSLNDSHDVDKRIDQASKAFYAMNKNVFRKREIPIKLRLRTYQAIIVNLALWGCESWALKEDDRRKLEVFHHRCLRRMLNLTIYEVKEQHITNKEVRKRAGNSYSMQQMMELRRCRWLEKLSKMNDKRGPRKILAAWCPTARPTGKPQQTIRHGYATTLTTLGFTSTLLEDWMTVAKNVQTWARRVEWKLGLVPGTYQPKKLRPPPPWSPPLCQIATRLMPRLGRN